MYVREKERVRERRGEEGRGETWASRLFSLLGETADTVVEHGQNGAHSDERCRVAKARRPLTALTVLFLPVTLVYNVHTQSIPINIYFRKKNYTDTCISYRLKLDFKSHFT